MKATLNLVSLLLIVVVVISNTNGPVHRVSGHFYPNVTSIPPSLSPNGSIWAPFNKLAGCQKGVKAQGLAQLKKYFQLFGYINSSYQNFSDEFDDRLDAAVRAYQINFNLESTGEIDAPTLRHLVLPRCGNPDAVNGTSTMHRSGNSSNTFGAGPIRAVAHYSFFPGRPRWPPRRTRLTYAFLPGNQLSAAVRAVFARAFARWAAAVPLTFAEVTGYDGADIRIGFYGGDHGDGEPFDGVLGTLAHAFSPPVGRLHLDSEESWVVDGGFVGSPGVSAVDLESVAVHEIGHLLGLGHSSVEEAIMYPTISTGTRKVELANDDVMGVQELYGSNPNYTGPVLTPRDERDTSGGAPRVYVCGILLVVGLFSLLFLFV